MGGWEVSRLRALVRRTAPLAALVVAVAAACESGKKQIEPVETFHWVAQPIAFSPPPKQWERQGDNGGGMLGVRFILTGGGGQCISVAAYHLLAERDRQAALERLIARRDSLAGPEFLTELSQVRARTDDPITAQEAVAARLINAAIDRAMAHHRAGLSQFVVSDLEEALQAAASYELTLEDILPRVRLQPARMNEPERWRIGYERDTTIAGYPAFASDDTLFTPERPLLYHEVYWVVRRAAFKATYQGTSENLPAFHQLVESIRFPEVADAAPQ